jgi:hypothetical protein
MAGIDVALGVIPLLVQAAKYSHTVYQQFKRWRKYASELEEFQEELFCYQCVFRKDCSLLLGSVTTTAEVDRIMECHVTELENLELERKLKFYLNDQYDCCEVVMKKINQELDILHAKSQRFQDVITVPDSVSIPLLYTTFLVLCRSPLIQSRPGMNVSGNEHGGPSKQKPSSALRARRSTKDWHR